MNNQQTYDLLAQTRQLLLNGVGTSKTTAKLYRAMTEVSTDIAVEARRYAQYTELMEIGKRAAASLSEMVAALNVDYDRLEELREAKNAIDIDDDKALIEFADSDDGKELTQLESQAGECNLRDDAEQCIHEDALSVECRGDWYSLNGDGDDGVPTEFKILLTTGGPAVRIMGELQDGEPHRAWLEVQNWGQPWTQYHEAGLSDVLLDYARCFSFGEWL